MKTWTSTAVIGLLLAGCGTAPNQRVVTRTSTYMKAMTFGSAVGYPVDFAELERRYPELKGIVISAPQWVEEYEKLRKEADERGTPLYEYRIPFGANLTIEVTGEKDLTRTYTVPPSGFVHYPYLSKLKVAGLTIDELKDQLQRDLAVYLKKPEVLIHINVTPYQPNQLQPFYQQTFGGADIILMGVAQSRFFSNIAFTGKETLLGVLGNAVLPDNAEWRQIRVIRRDSKDPLRKSRVIICDLWDYFAKADVRQDIPLAPGDVVFVPQRWSVDDQFWEDWSYVKNILDNVTYLGTFRDSIKAGGSLRN
ncbi:MAG TPA: polysaccharide biosynthesis/export family protein [Planctomycetota bacterium]|nr:polysaccharide biosynthesis/export family protein [Planctomycetota bacterium]